MVEILFFDRFLISLWAKYFLIFGCKSVENEVFRWKSFPAPMFDFGLIYKVIRSLIRGAKVPGGGSWCLQHNLKKMFFPICFKNIWGFWIKFLEFLADHFGSCDFFQKLIFEKTSWPRGGEFFQKKHFGGIF